jgi:dephospho-CoA kinase
MKQDGMELNYENEKITREKIREEMGMGGYAMLAKPTIKELLTSNEVVIIESLYSWDEYKILKEEFGDIFEVLAIFASPKTRFKRLNSRVDERPIKDIEVFVKRDYNEIEKTDKGGPIARADYMIVNEGTEEDLYKQIDTRLINK